MLDYSEIETKIRIPPAKKRDFLYGFTDEVERRNTEPMIRNYWRSATNEELKIQITLKKQYKKWIDSFNLLIEDLPKSSKVKIEKINLFIWSLIERSGEIPESIQKAKEKCNDGIDYFHDILSLDISNYEIEESNREHVTEEIVIEISKEGNFQNRISIMNKPKIFIGSSVEGLSLANAIHRNLDHDAEITIWTQGVFHLSRTTISDLVTALDNFDFAIFVFSPDDITSMRDKTMSAVRDNVIYETGLFSGKLGIERVFFIIPRNNVELHLPTDLLGVKAGDYDSKRSDGNLAAATGPFCDEVRQRIRALGSFTSQLKNSSSSDSSLKDLQLITAYMKDKQISLISFERMRDDIHPKLTEELVMRLVETFPTIIRRCKLKNGAKGIKRLST